jgi:hypothetical protein
VVVVAIVAVVYLLGALGSRSDGSGSGGTLAPFDRPDAAPGSGAAAAGGAGSDVTGSEGGSPGQPGQQNPPAGSTGVTPPTTAGPPPNQNPPPLSARLAASYTKTALNLTSFRVNVTVTNSGGSSGQWSWVAAALTGVNLHINVLSSTVTFALRHGNYCFLPTGSVATVAPGASVSFSFTVGVLSGGLGTIDSVTLDSPACA